MCFRRFVCNEVTIYALFDTRRPHAIRYVGQTAQLETRINAHCSGQDDATKSWVQEVQEIGGNIAHKVLAVCQPDNALLSEEYWIERMRDDGHVLLNGFVGSVGPTTLGCKNCKRLAKQVKHLRNLIERR